MAKSFKTIVLTEDNKNLYGIENVSIIDANNCKITCVNGDTNIRKYKELNGVIKFQYKENWVKVAKFRCSVESIPSDVPELTLKPSFDYSSFEYEEGKQVNHKKYDTIKSCVVSDIPVYLAGPAGSGKNHTLEQIASDLNLEFYFTNSVQQEYKLTGFIDANGTYHETEFYKAFKNGGLFFLDEMDASIPEVLVLLNAAIANRYFEFPNGKIKAHEDFRVVSAGNTVGNGADEQYTGRLVLDQATLDRFVIIEFGYDMGIEIQLSKGNTDLVNFIEDIRKFSTENGIRATFSYRCIITTVKLEKAGMGVLDILEIAVFKGLDKDTIKTFDVSGNTTYYKALEILKAA